MTIEETIEAAVARAIAPLVEAVQRLDRGDSPEVLTPAQAAEVLNTSESQVRRWAQRGVLDRVPHTKTVLIPRLAVHAFLDEAAERKQAHDRKVAS